LHWSVQDGQDKVSLVTEKTIPDVAWGGLGVTAWSYCCDVVLPHEYCSKNLHKVAPKLVQFIMTISLVPAIYPGQILWYIQSTVTSAPSHHNIYASSTHSHFWLLSCLWSCVPKEILHFKNFLLICFLIVMVFLQVKLLSNASPVLQFPCLIHQGDTSLTQLILQSICHYQWQLSPQSIL